MTKIKLNEIICNVPDEADKDEIFLKLNGQKIWPQKSKYQKIGVDEAIDVNIGGEFDGEWVEVELWDFDFASRNDHLGTFHLELNQTSGHYGTILSNNMDVSEEADYMLNWEILEG